MLYGAMIYGQPETMACAITAMPGHSSDRSPECATYQTRSIAYARPGRIVEISAKADSRIRQRSWGSLSFAVCPVRESRGISARTTHLPFFKRHSGVLAGGSADVFGSTFACTADQRRLPRLLGFPARSCG
jgi:hypothetical protein